MDIVLKLRELRRMRCLTQREAALSSGIGEKTLSTFETGERIASMKLSQLLALLAVYDSRPLSSSAARSKPRSSASLSGSP